MGTIHTIQKRLAFLLLIVFALSVTPKVVFHGLLADHQDGFVCRDTDKSVPHIHEPAFHCSFDDLVVTSPYLFSESPGIQAPTEFYPAINTDFAALVLSRPLLHRESRGPPLT